MKFPFSTTKELNELIRKNEKIVEGGDFWWREFLTTSKKFKFPVMPLLVGRNIYRLVDLTLQPLRIEIGEKFKITSGWRPKLLNKLVGGVWNSNHIKAQAVDVVVEDFMPKEVLHILIVMSLPYYQLIDERARYTTWAHIALTSDLKPHKTRPLLDYKLGRTPAYQLVEDF